MKDYHIPYIIRNRAIEKCKIRAICNNIYCDRVGVSKECGFGEIGAI
ncbi:MULTISPECIES: hypothetical protein [Clostridium]|nr:MULTISPECIES: hypothetical protein [Clostridium]